MQVLALPIKEAVFSRHPWTLSLGMRNRRRDEIRDLAEVSAKLACCDPNPGNQIKLATCRPRARARASAALLEAVACTESACRRWTRARSYRQLNTPCRVPAAIMPKSSPIRFFVCSTW